jgi:hypothetical protein
MLLRRVIIATSALTIALGMSLATTSDAYASNAPIVNFGSSWLVQNNGHDNYVTMGSPGQSFTAQNAQHWNGVDVWQWQSGGLCLTEAPDRSVRMESCSSRASSTYWYTLATGGGGGEIWFISVYYTDVHGTYGYMTEISPAAGSRVSTYGPGYGDAAVWVVP